jgi:hypothetical protein
VARTSSYFWPISRFYLAAVHTLAGKTMAVIRSHSVLVRADSIPSGISAASSPSFGRSHLSKGTGRLTPLSCKVSRCGSRCTVHLTVPWWTIFLWTNCLSPTQLSWCQDYR